MKENSTVWYESLRKPEIAWFAIAAVWALWMLEPFYFTGMTTSDQLEYSLVKESDALSIGLRTAQSQGRIYFLLTKPIDFIMAANPVSGILHGLNFLVFALSPIALAYSVFRESFSRYLFLFLFVCLSWVGYYHMPPAAYPIVNHMVFPVWTVVALLLRRREGTEVSTGRLVTLFCLIFLSVFQYEPVASMSVVVVFWLIYSSEFASEDKRKLYGAFLSAVVLYGVLYIVWSKMYPSNYDGLESGDMSPLSILKPIVSYTVGSLPFLTPDMNTFYLELSKEEAWATGVALKLFDTWDLKAWEWVLFASAAFSVFAIFCWKWSGAEKALSRCSAGSSTVRSDSRRLLGLLLLGVALALAPNVLLGFSSKYQAWAGTWRDAYLTSQLSLYGWCVVFVSLIRWLFLVVGFKRRSVALVMVIVACMAIAIPNRTRNESLANSQRAMLARWEVVAVLNSAKSHWEADVLFVPQLRLTSFATRSDWNSYWRRYSKNQYGWDINFEHDSDKAANDSRERRVGIRYFTNDEGYLTTVLVQSGAMLHVVALVDAPPRSMVSNTTGKGIPFNWGAESRDLDYGDYRILTLDLGALEAGVVDPLKPSSSVDIWF